MDENDFAAPPSAVGILHCLRLLAQEAASLKLLRSLSAIEDALEMVACETGADLFTDDVRAPAVHHVIH